MKTSNITRPFKILKRSAFCSLLLLMATINNVSSQVDSTTLYALVKETREIFLHPYAPGIYLTPYEIREHHRDRKIKNIEQVDSLHYYRTTSSKTEHTPFLVENNRTIIEKPDEEFNAHTYLYHKDGRLHKFLRGRHTKDLYLTDDDGFLIQHGNGGELKKAKRKGKTFEWYNVSKDRLEYVTSFDDQNRISSIKIMGYFSGPAIEHRTEEYVWEGSKLVATNKIVQYKSNTADSTFIQIQYDELGMPSGIKSRDGNQTYWNSVSFSPKIEHHKNDNLKISIISKDITLFSMTYDHFGNWIEMVKSIQQIRREFIYRKKKRRK